MKKQSGFTLIELVMVIVILGILAAIALPKFVDLSKDAKVAAIQGIAGSLSAAGTMNFATRSLHPASGIATAVAGVGQACSGFGALFEGGVVPAGYVLGGTAPACTVDTTVATSAVTATVPLIN